MVFVNDSPGQLGLMLTCVQHYTNLREQLLFACVKLLNLRPSRFNEILAAPF
jgi:hypothetical protein